VGGDRFRSHRSDIHQEKENIIMKKFTYPLLLVLASCTPSKEKVVSSTIDELFSNEFNTDEPGGAVLILKGDKIIFEKGYGLADLQTKEKITPQTIFNIGSISKSFVSNATLVLQQEGKLSVEGGLARYFPDFKNKTISQKVKIKNILTHTSGLPDNRRQHLDSVALLTAKDAENWAPILLNDSLEFQPGERYEYSNPAFNGLALIVEKTSGKKWQEYVNEKILKPSGMANSLITDGAFPERGVAHAYLKVRNQYIEKDYGEEPTFAAAGNGGVWSSVEELAKYEIAIRKNVFLPAAVIEDTRTVKTFPNWKSAAAPEYGYSWVITQTEDGLKEVSHTGTQGGFHADYVSIPSKGILYVVLCNKPFPREAFRQKILALLQQQNWLD
jgi:CubicO group peptidase (beta-lactamase class C family)